MILGIGSDLIDIRRIEKSLVRFGERFEARLFTPAECAKAAQRSTTKAATLAKRFAAKEAFAKALGTGIGQGISWLDMEVISDASGCPSLQITGAALYHLQQRTPAGKQAHIHLSLSDEYPYAQAFVIISSK